MLSKAKGQILRVSASLSLLFSIGNDEDTIHEPAVTHISEDVLRADINFVDVCCEHTAFMAGRGAISEEISGLVDGIIIHQYYASFFPCITREHVYMSLNST